MSSRGTRGLSLPLAAGRLVLRVRPISKPGGAVMTLRSLHLRPIPVGR